nr:MAG TPA: hypothetical protein [Caudoviricetes sp.]
MLGRSTWIFETCRANSRNPEGAKEVCARSVLVPWPGLDACHASIVSGIQPRRGPDGVVMMTSASGRRPLRMYERMVGTARPTRSATAAVPRYSRVKVRPPCSCG